MDRTRGCAPCGVDARSQIVECFLVEPRNGQSAELWSCPREPAPWCQEARAASARQTLVPALLSLSLSSIYFFFLSLL